MVAITRPLEPPTGLTLKYDAWNRLVDVRRLIPVKYQYDGLNRRIARYFDYPAVEHYRHRYYNSSWQIVESRNDLADADPENVEPYVQYVWSPRYIDAAVLRDENTDSDGLCDDERLYYLCDANFNVTTLTDTAGDAVERYLYDPYGKGTIYTGDWSTTRSSSSYANAIRYTGREYDPETGLYHYRTCLVSGVSGVWGQAVNSE